MFDIGFSELLLFGVIALIVLGPEKLPQAARTAGQWYAKIRRTVSTLQSEIEAELDLAETRQLMQKELAKIRQTEADMRREMAEIRGNMKEFEHSQSQNLKPSQTASNNKRGESDIANNEDVQDKQSQNHEPLSIQGTEQVAKKGDDENIKNASRNDTRQTIQPLTTRPWENMWFRLGAYDKARRLPVPPYLPNYKADALLNSHLGKEFAVKEQVTDS
ncbi:Sec-independent protein translocase protein TatB [Psychrobacter aquaticus]|uniref:Sec-independent protein translocase protein TatB n=1 Tax=Psychrobacter aquaticus CMS 56 TaxID=1354303 RepID=U4TDT7_9GAMM|nr:Sec-independent protein translocase protein TatB [Psychrobacter aquaticus]ERL56909.1 Twin-arginine translocation protein TatB [Psychrobacter aquaticus CMS 56]